MSARAVTPRIEASTDCIAVHVRRGDACLNPDRRCHPYPEYLEATGRLQRALGLSRIYVLSDADDLPLDEWRTRFTVEHQSAMNRSLYRPQPLARQDVGRVDSRTFPEHRVARGELGSLPVEEVLTDLRRAARCRAFVGTLSAGISKIIFALMLAVNGQIPPFVSLGGCTYQISSPDFREMYSRCTSAIAHHPPLAVLQPYLRRAARWIKRSRVGFCSVTDEADKGNCNVGASGSFGFADDDPGTSWNRSVAACLWHCRRCARCRFVSVSLRQRDCSWFHGPCGIDAAAALAADFRTARSSSSDATAN